MIGESGVGTGTDSAESNLPEATCVGIVDGGGVEAVLGLGEESVLG